MINADSKDDYIRCNVKEKFIKFTEITVYGNIHSRIIASVLVISRTRNNNRIRPIRA